MILTLTSASGAPGVTTTALTLALTWPNPVLLVEADTTRPSAMLAGYFAGGTPPDRGIVGLVLPARDGSLSDRDVLEQAFELGEHRHLVPGLTQLGQAESLRHAWPVVARTLTGMSHAGMDVIIDAGRLGPSTPTPLLAASDVLALTTGTRLPDFTALAERAAQLVTDPATIVGVLAVRDAQPYSGKEIAKELGLPLLAVIVDDPVAAAHISTGTDYRRFARSRLAASASSASAAITQTLAKHRSHLGLAGVDHPVEAEATR